MTNQLILQPMVVPERNKYILKNKIRGDVKMVSVSLGLKISTVSDIVNGKFEGTNGEKILKLFEIIIRKRAKKEKRIKKKYALKLKR